VGRKVIIFAIKTVLPVAMVLTQRCGNILGIVKECRKRILNDSKIDIAG
jgi:hypothetical protein